MLCKRAIIVVALGFIFIDVCSALCELKWVKTDHKNIPANSVLGNTGNKLGDFYPSRAVFDGVLTPGRFKPAEQKCFITLDGKEHSVSENFEVLTNPNHCTLQWKQARDGTLPPDSIIAGKDKQGGYAYVARISANGGFMVGKFYESTGKAYYGWGGGEHANSMYQILTVIDPKDVRKIEPGCHNHQTFGHDSFVCVCSEAQPCEKVDAPVKTKHGVVTKWESSQTGARFKHETLQFEPLTTHVNINKSSTQYQISIDRNKRYQEIFGFGGSFTDSTGINIKKVPAKLQDQILRDYFSQEGLEYNVARIPIAGSDFSTRGYTYDDVENDKKLEHFALTVEDHDYKIPFIKKAKSMATHEIRFFGSPWSAPKWMKTNNELIHGGHIKGAVGSEYWQIYAKYFVKYLNAYKAEGINHWGITVQNEPLASQRWNSMSFSAESTRDFLKLSLGPELERSGYGPDKLKVMILDHNLSLVKNWVTKVFSDKEASKYAHGTAVHWYGHDPKEMLDEPHAMHPDKFILATEACQEGGVHLGDWKLADLYASDILGDLLHHTIGWTDWNMVLDMQGGPNWVNNFVDAPIIVDSKKNEYYRQPSYYALGHFSKFLPPGSVRIGSPVKTSHNNHALVGAFRTPANATVIIAVNTEDLDIDFIVEDPMVGNLVTKIAPRSIQSYIYYD